MRRAVRHARLLLGGAALSTRGQRAAARVASATGARLLAETFPARWERGAGLPAIERLPYFPEQAVPLLADARPLVLAGACDPVAFFGYPGQPSRLGPDEPAHCLAAPEEDANAALEALAEALGAGPEPPPELQPPPSPSGVPGGALTPASLGAVVAGALPEGAIVVDEAATSGLPFYAASQDSRRHSLLTLTGGAIGQGLPCATGAALACPDRKVIALQADGGAMYTFQALWTQAREGLDVITVLCSNRAYRILQIELARAGVSAPGPQARGLTQLDRPELDWCALARGCGVEAERAENAEQLARALGRALSASGPHLIEAVL